MQPIFQATAGGLWKAACTLAAIERPCIGLITGFFVPGGHPPAAETDGPAGAALLARAINRLGLTCRVATDDVCLSACRAALLAAGAASVPIDAIRPQDDTADLTGRWRAAGIDCVIAIERCGPGVDGASRNMRGVDISAHAARLDRLFRGGAWRTIAVGDGGNELGMGSLPSGLVATHVPLGEVIACTVPADFLVTAGVSHWGAYALLAALALLRPDWTQVALESLAPALDQAVVEAMVREGPAVDGVSLSRSVTIDAQPMTVHHEVLIRILGAMRPSLTV
ncbi:MAG TPA: glutamate cyclase domain-containing protein [Rhodopila sp.]|nr:glutamate cyclase domain-containing protein [Rhodopila sp.]